jgi:glycerophosphoryl diester phosphodiesterase
MRSHGLETRQVQLIDGNGVDFKIDKVLNNNITSSRPFEWTVSGDSHW